MPNKDPEKRRAYGQAYREAHRGEAQAYREAHRGEAKAYAQAHREELNAYHQAYNRAHLEKRRAQSRAYNDGHQEKRQAYEKTRQKARQVYHHSYYLAHQPQYATYHSRRRAWKRGARHQPYKREEIVQRDRSICGLCGKKVAGKDESIDHILPLSLGGDDAPYNVQLAHLRCNTQKNNSARFPTQLRLAFIR